MLPRALVHDLRDLLAVARLMFEEDRARQRAGVALPHALTEKYPGHARAWAWFWTFPARKLPKDPRSGVVRRHHVFEQTFQRAVARAVARAAIAKPATSHTLRHSFATHPLEAGYDSPLDRR